MREGGGEPREKQVKAREYNYLLATENKAKEKRGAKVERCANRQRRIRKKERERKN